MKCAVIVFPGSNCERDCGHVAAEVCGGAVAYVWHKETRLPAVDAVILPGGFSYGDYLRAGAIAHLSPIMAAVVRFAHDGGLVLGSCNGFQILTEAGLLPGALMRNAALQFECRDVWLRVERTDTPFTCAYAGRLPATSTRPPAVWRDQRVPAGSVEGPATVVKMPIAHMDGNYYVDPETLRQMESHGQILFRYCAPDGRIDPSANPNGSLAHIAGICNVAGNVLGLMPHPERCSEMLLGGTDGRGVFESMNQWPSRTNR